MSIKSQAQPKLEFNKRKFLKSEFGVVLRDSAERFWYFLVYPNTEEAAFYEVYEVALNDLLVALNQCYGVSYYLVADTRTSIKIVSQEDGDVLFRIKKGDKKCTY